MDLDLDILHQPDTHTRRTGRTVRILVEAIQNADFMPEGSTIFIIGHTHAFAFQMVETAMWAAAQLGFEVKLGRDRSMLEINGRSLKFTTSPKDMLGHDPEMTAVFWDHHVLGY